MTHAEWYVEVIDTYCKTIMIASQLKKPLNEIPPDKIADLLAIKKTLGLPDARFAQDEIEEPLRNVVISNGNKPSPVRPSEIEIDRLVDSVSGVICEFLARSGN